MDRIINYIKFVTQIYLKACNFLVDNWKEIFGVIEVLANLPEISKKAGDEWVKFGWVPFLPDFQFEAIADALNYPTSQVEADKRMIDSLERCTYDFLFQKLSELLVKKKINLRMFEESIFCYKNDQFTSCVLNIFSIIDACFLEGQPKADKKTKRALSRTAVRKMFENDNNEDYMLILYVTIELIKETFKDADDFSIEEDRLYRNFISHGMNKRIVSKMDCEKMFVLLYNILELFDAGLFTWENEEENDEK